MVGLKAFILQIPQWLPLFLQRDEPSKVRFYLQVLYSHTTAVALQSALLALLVTVAISDEPSSACNHNLIARILLIGKGLFTHVWLKLSVFAE